MEWRGAEQAQEGPQASQPGGTPWGICSCYESEDRSCRELPYSDHDVGVTDPHLTQSRQEVPALHRDAPLASASHDRESADSQCDTGRQDTSKRG